MQRSPAMRARSTNNPRRWSRHVTETSHALDLEPNVFNLGNPRAIAASLKRSAEQSTHRKAEPFRSALSMLVFYINRAGKNLSPERRRTLERAKDELRLLFGRKTVDPSAGRRKGTTSPRTGRRPSRGLQGRKRTRRSPTDA